MDFELPKVKEDSEDISNANSEPTEVIKKDSSVSEENLANENIFDNVVFKPESDDESDSSIILESDVSNIFGTQGDFSEPVEYVVDDIKVENNEVKEPENINLNSKLNDDLENPENRFFSKKSSMAFVVLCVAVVFFSLGGLVGFYFGTKKTNNEGNQPKENISENIPPKQEDKNVPPPKPENDNEEKENEMPSNGRISGSEQVPPSENGNDSTQTIPEVVIENGEETVQSNSQDVIQQNPDAPVSNSNE